jgi:hypothetical protein
MQKSMADKAKSDLQKIKAKLKYKVIEASRLAAALAKAQDQNRKLLEESKAAVDKLGNVLAAHAKECARLVRLCRQTGVSWTS